MKKSVKILLGVLLIASLTSISFYRKYLKKQASIEQQVEARKEATKIFNAQKELKVKQQEEERLRLLDSAGQAKLDQLDAGMKQLREARSKIEKEIKENN